MEFQQVLNKLISEIVKGIYETSDKDVLRRYQRILDYLNMIIELKGDKKCIKN